MFLSQHSVWYFYYIVFCGLEKNGMVGDGMGAAWQV